MNVYLDESGDLGWSLDKPYRNGGSSRYLTIAALIIPKTHAHLPKRIIRKFYKSRELSSSGELKGQFLTKDETSRFIQKLIHLLEREPSITISVITVKKENVQPHIRSDANKLYNYMVHFAILQEIRECAAVDFIPDPRTIKVASGNSLVDYLKTKLWFELNSATVIRHIPVESKKNLTLQFIDFIAHVVWSRYENNEYDPYRLIRPYITERHLFF
ncbi:MAG TPA: DUF3800 domain-containing protein [Deltaproteobacteria bacterium]|nr:DUF3800 domain-containing protein [Deltaproteobacteria bacterium]